jgi:hypothetical protein
MMLHQDGSRHVWLQGRPALDLFATLDHATSAIDSARVSALRRLFAPALEIAGRERRQLLRSQAQFPTPDKTDSSRAIFDNVPITVNGVASTFAEFALLTFPIFTHQGFSYSLPNAPSVPFVFSGTAIFQGSLGAPQLVPGDFTESGHVNGQAASFELLATLDLGSPAPVPELTTWTAMICGLCALGVVRWRRSVVFMRRTRDGQDKPGRNAYQQLTI